VLALEAIVSGYGDAVVLRDVDLTVATGEVIALLGPNGAGKSTLLRTASGFVKPMSGRIEVDGADLTGAPGHRYAARGVCLLPEGRGIFPSLTVLENIRVQAGRKPGRRLPEILDEVGELFPVLRQRLGQTAGDLSGGEQQMLALARGLATDPAVLLLDELSMGLAPLIVTRLYEEVAEIARQGVAVLVVEQFAAAVLGIANRAAVVVRGRLSPLDGTDDSSRAELAALYLGSSA